MQRLEKEIRPSLAALKTPPEDVEGEAHRLASQFLQLPAQMRAVLKTDVQAAFDGDPAAGSYDEVILAHPGLEAISRAADGACALQAGRAADPADDD